MIDYDRLYDMVLVFSDQMRGAANDFGSAIVVSAAVLGASIIVASFNLRKK